MRRKRPKRQPKTTFGKIWYFIWEEDSLASWIVNVILAFVLIKFLVYPGLGLILDTSHPVVAVVSGSMYHGGDHPCIKKDSTTSECLAYDTNLYFICNKTYSQKIRKNFDTYWSNCGDWYVDRNITKEEFKKFPMSNGFSKGDIIVLHGYGAPKIGNIIVFNRGKSYPIIHRIVSIDDKQQITTKGDHNADSGDVDININPNTVIGKAYFKIPYIGYVKIFAVDLLRFLHIIG